MKYIDVEELKDKIKSLQCEQGFDTGEAERAYQSAIKDILDIIDSLQQEQPEVNLEKEIDDWYNTVGIPVTADALKETAHHFFEFGIRTRKEEVK